jgi:hypothetical protein
MRFGTLEVLLIAAVVTLLLQLFPAAARTLLWMLDVRNWPRTVWLWLNVGVVLVLFGIRFGPALVRDWRGRQARLQAEHQDKQRQKDQREHREMIGRLKEGRRRRLY